MLLVLLQALHGLGADEGDAFVAGGEDRGHGWVP
jgi:hypothetical protein